MFSKHHLKSWQWDNFFRDFFRFKEQAPVPKEPYLIVPLLAFKDEFSGLAVMCHSSKR